MKSATSVRQNPRVARFCLVYSLATSVLIPAAWAGGTVTNATEAALRAAMAGGGLVTFACDGTITLTNTVTNVLNTILDGTGHRIAISGGNAVRVFDVPTNSTLTVIHLTVASGYAYGLYLGQGFGAGIANEGGTVNLVGITLQSNVTYAVGADGRGGAVLNLGGRICATNCVFSRNTTRLAIGWSSSIYGGAVANIHGQFTAVDCAFYGNTAGDSYPENSRNGYPALGGAIYNTGTLELRNCTLATNWAVGTAGGSSAGSYGVSGGSGGSGLGSAIFSSGSACLINCTITGNQASGGNGGQGGNGMNAQFAGNGGAGGNGGSGLGAIYATNLLVMTNCTFALNSASAGTGGVGGAGGISTWPPPHGANGLPGPNGNPGTAGAGLIAPNAVLVNCILASNSPASNTVVLDLGHNLSSESAFTASSSLNNTNPMLGPLADNGGPTLTMALLPRSPAIKAGSSVGAPITDQRGVARPRQAAVDIGAFQYSFDVPELYFSQIDPGDIRLLAAGKPTQTCRLLTSDNLAAWTPTATNQFGADGTALFQDDWSSRSPRGFYRLVTP